MWLAIILLWIGLIALFAVAVSMSSKLRRIEANFRQHTNSDLRAHAPIEISGDTDDEVGSDRPLPPDDWLLPGLNGRLTSPPEDVPERETPVERMLATTYDLEEVELWVRFGRMTTEQIDALAIEDENGKIIHPPGVVLAVDEDGLGQLLGPIRALVPRREDIPQFQTEFPNPRLT